MVTKPSQAKPSPAPERRLAGCLLPESLEELADPPCRRPRHLAAEGLPPDGFLEKIKEIVFLVDQVEPGIGEAVDLRDDPLDAQGSLQCQLVESAGDPVAAQTGGRIDAGLFVVVENSI